MMYICTHTPHLRAVFFARVNNGITIYTSTKYNNNNNNIIELMKPSTRSWNGVTPINSIISRGNKKRTTKTDISREPPPLTSADLQQEEDDLVQTQYNNNSDDEDAKMEITSQTPGNLDKEEDSETESEYNDNNNNNNNISPRRSTRIAQQQVPLEFPQPNKLKYTKDARRTIIRDGLDNKAQYNFDDLHDQHYLTCVEKNHLYVLIFLNNSILFLFFLYCYIC